MSTTRNNCIIADPISHTGARELFIFFVKKLRGAYEHGTTPMPEQVVAQVAQPKSAMKRHRGEIRQSEEKEEGQRRKKKRHSKKDTRIRPQRKTVEWAEDLVEVRVIPRRPRSRLPDEQ